MNTEETTYLFNAGEDREKLNVARWLETRGYAYLCKTMGRPHSPIWIGLFLSRSLVLGDSRLQGDIDIIIGSMCWDLTVDEWYNARQRWKKSSPPGIHPSNFDIYVEMDAVEAGKLLWDPEMCRLDAFEAKASWFDSEHIKWKHTHTGRGKQRTILGQIGILQEAGFDRVALVHLATSSPKLTDLNPWLQASDDSIRAHETLPIIVDLKKT